MSRAIEEITGGNYTAKIYFDDCPMNPRKDFTCITTIIAWHKRYNLSDKSAIERWSSPEAFSEYYESHRKEFPVIKSLYGLDHESLTLSTTKFPDPWDSGQLGYVFIDKQSFQREFSFVTDDSVAQAEKCIAAEIDEYNMYIQGDIYGYEIIDDLGDTIDECYGFYGLKNVKEEATRVLSSLANDENETKTFYVNVYTTRHLSKQVRAITTPTHEFIGGLPIVGMRYAKKLESLLRNNSYYSRMYKKGLNILIEDDSHESENNDY